MDNATLVESVQSAEWHSELGYVLPEWAEPLIVVGILVSAMFLTRRKWFSIFGADNYKPLLLEIQDLDSVRSSEDTLFYDIDYECDQESLLLSKHQSKRRALCCGLKVHTPNTSRFANHFHSRILQKFPFLMEMFYWVITYLFYRLTKVVSQAVFSDNIWEIAQSNGLRVLWFEQKGPLRFLFPVKEYDVQRWFMDGHRDALTILNRTYALIHIPGTVGYICWYYYVAPNHSIFAVARRTLTLTNLFAFIVFTCYPTMPPRLLPKQYGFFDTVRHDNAESVWMSGKFVNMLAAMPSMHFGYAFCIGSTMLYHSGIFRQRIGPVETKRSTFWKVFYLVIGIGYPILVLSAIVATANHYWLDAIVAIVAGCLAFVCNRVFLILLPLEDYLLWMLRLEKPIPSTGERFYARRGKM